MLIFHYSTGQPSSLGKESQKWAEATFIQLIYLEKVVIFNFFI